MPLARTYMGQSNIRGNSGKQIQIIDIVKQTWTNPATAVTNGFSASHAGAVPVGTRDMVLGGSLTTGGVGIADFARNVVINATHGSAVVAMSGIIYGTDINGDPYTEAWSVSAGGTTKTHTGTKAFKTVTRITEVIAADASTNTIIAGTGVLLGFLTKVTVASLVKEYSAGSLVTNGTLVVASTASTADNRGTYSPNTAPNGATTYLVYFLSEDAANDRGVP